MALHQTTSPTRLAWEALFDVGDGPGSLVERLERAIRDAVRTGRVPPGAALPASRRLAEALGVSRWVVTEVYGQLAAEGVLEARTGSATRVAPGAAGGSAGGPTSSPGAATVLPLPSAAARAAFDLAPGVPDLRHVPREAWLRAAREALAVATREDLGGQPWSGHPAARATVASHLRRSRLIGGTDHGVVLTHGATHSIACVAAALVAAGHTHLLVEDPSWPVLREVALRAGLTAVPVPVDDDGVDVGELVASAARTGARAALLTPAHQFPTGVALAPDRRHQIVTWAREVDGLVIEDDYDAEFRYDRRPVAALQRFDAERTLLLGSVSKTLAPAFALGWMVVPPAWREPVARAWATSAPSGLVSPSAGPSVVDQLAFARFVSSGGYDRHLRATRTRYRRRRDAVLAALGRELPDARVRGIAAGMHLLLELAPGDRPGPDAADVAREAAARDVAVVDLRRYQVRPAGRSTTLVLGYGNLADARVDEAVARLAAAVRAAAAPRRDSDPAPR